MLFSKSKLSNSVFQNISHIVSWEPEGRYYSSKMFCWEPEGRYCHRLCTAIAPFWFSTEHLWTAITPFWLSTDNIQYSMCMKWHFFCMMQNCIFVCLFVGCWIFTFKQWIYNNTNLYVTKKFINIPLLWCNSLWKRHVSYSQRVVIEWFLRILNSGYIMYLLENSYNNFSQKWHLIRFMHIHNFFFWSKLLPCLIVLYHKASSRGAYGHDPFLIVFEE